MRSIRGTWHHNQCLTPKRIWSQALSRSNRRHRAWEWSDHTPTTDVLFFLDYRGYQGFNTQDIHHSFQIIDEYGETHFPPHFHKSSGQKIPLIHPPFHSPKGMFHNPFA